ncbi:MAG: hypothetical protein KME55_40915 [Nostoc indistinguendum CM1-VF10]|jgi:hypothetical protein|nr:hypothetical protein [Nostoc indistinguendum CM1-VF10]
MIKTTKTKTTGLNCAEIYEELSDLELEKVAGGEFKGNINKKGPDHYGSSGSRDVRG